MLVAIWELIGISVGLIILIPLLILIVATIEVLIEELHDRLKQK